MAEQIVGSDVDGHVLDVVVAPEGCGVVQLAPQQHGAGGLSRDSEVAQPIRDPVVQAQLPMHLRYVAIRIAIYADRGRQRVPQRYVVLVSLDRCGVNPRRIRGYVDLGDRDAAQVSKRRQEYPGIDAAFAAGNPGDDDDVIADNDALHVGALFGERPVQVGNPSDHVFDGVAGHARHREHTHVGLEQLELQLTPRCIRCELSVYRQPAVLEVTGESDEGRLARCVEDVDGDALKRRVGFGKRILQHRVQLPFR